MPTTLVDEHRAELSDIALLLAHDLSQRWQPIPPGVEAAAIRQDLTSLSLDLVDYYGGMAAGAGADWYDEMRAAAEVRGRYVARPVNPVALARVEAAVGYSLGPLLGADVANDLARSRLGGELQKLVTNAERETVLDSTQRDPAQPRWYRYASANACSFCAMLASRGAVYRSQESSDFKSHGHCGCFPVPLFQGQDIEVPHIHDFMQDYMDGRDSAADAGDDLTTKNVLSHMRAVSGRK